MPSASCSIPLHQHGFDTKPGKDAASLPGSGLTVSVDIVHGVVHVELAGRRNQALVLDHGLQLAGLVVHDHDRRLLVLAAPHREPDFIAGLVVFRLDHTLGPFTLDTGPLGNRQDLKTLVEVVDVIDGNALADTGIRVQR